MAQKQIKINISPLRLSSASTVQIPSKLNYFNHLQPSVLLARMNLSSIRTINMTGLQSVKCINLKIKLSPIRSPILRKYNISTPANLNDGRRRSYPFIYKCNFKRCKCCSFLNCNSTLKSTVNGRTFSININSDIDWQTDNIIYVLTWNALNCGIQYVGQTGRPLKTRFSQHCSKIRNNSKINTFLYKHFKQSGHTLKQVTVQPVEKLTFDNSASKAFKIRARLISEHKWIQKLQTPYPLGLNDNIYQEGNI